jgi:hypothetical protein
MISQPFYAAYEVLHITDTAWVTGISAERKFHFTAPALVQMRVRPFIKITVSLNMTPCSLVY